MNRIIPLLFIFLFTINSLTGQEEINWKKHKKLADKLYEAHQYADAAMHYEKAWQLHSKDRELIYLAGISYYQVKDYKKAIFTLQHVKKDNDQFNLVGLKYARSLKQDGQYELANQEFIYFINAYKGSDKTIVAAIVAKEIKGCELAMKELKKNETSKIRMTHLGDHINSPAIEFAPIPYTDDLLYFSTTKKGNLSSLFRSQRKNGNWNQSVIANGLPPFSNKHFANGSFAPDSKRFYFTLCDNGEGLNSKCEIYVLKREKSKWSTPIRLHDYINNPNANTTTQPWVVHQEGQEILYFASDREGGYGGMDIWYTTRNIDSEDIDFTYPVNAGYIVNTIGDEITPFYDNKKGVLYYSSNGKITMGGWDVFKTRGKLGQWEKPANLGRPINSSADDFYYVTKPSGKGGFLVSNRLNGVEKISTQHEDIFEFGPPENTTNLYALGQVLDAETIAPVNDVRITLYEIESGREKLLTSKKIVQSNYRFQILPEKKLRLIAEKNGYEKNIYDFDSYNADQRIDYTHVFTMIPKAGNREVLSASLDQDWSRQNYGSSPPYSAKVKSGKKRSVTTDSGVQRKNTGNRHNIAGSVSKAATGNKDSINKGTETHYKVQVIAVNYHNINHPRYNMIKKIGQVESEEIKEKGLTRVLIAGLSNRQEAEKIKEKVIGYGFVDAFVVKYRNGQRVGRLW